LFGYNGNPSLLELVSYTAYYLIVGIAIGLGQRTARSTEFPQKAPQHSN
jgi:hypothetical protein